MSVNIFVQARMGSSRLPGKAMRCLDGKPLLWYVLDRCSKTRAVDEVVVLTSVHERDEQIARYCSEIGIGCFRGSEENVFERFYRATEAFRPDVIVRICGDDPFVDVQAVERILATHLSSGADLTSTRDMSGDQITKWWLPRGFSVDVFGAPVLLAADLARLDSSEREHVVPYFFNRREQLRLEWVDFQLPGSILAQSYSVDTLADFDRTARILRRLDWDSFAMNDVFEIGATL